MAVFSNLKPSPQQHSTQERPRYVPSSFVVTHPQATGIDIGSRSHWVCVHYTTDPDDSHSIREFSAYTDGLRDLVAFLRQHGVTSVAMAATGIYWIPLFEMLVAEGFEVFLVNASYTKQVKGRPKTDRRDCRWIYRLHRVGLLSAAFRPSAATCVLRSYLRQPYQRKLDEVDAKIAEQLATMKLERPLPELPPDPKPHSSRTVNYPGFDVRAALYPVVGLDPTAIEGIADLTALTLVAEVGVDVSKFATVRNFTRWLGLCPNLKKTGGKVKSSATRHGANRAAQALRIAANSLWQSKITMGAYYRRMHARLGATKAIATAARKLAERVYYALKNGLPYVRQTEEQYEAMTRARQVKSLQRRARQLGFELRTEDPKNEQNRPVTNPPTP